MARSSFKTDTDLTEKTKSVANTDYQDEVFYENEPEHFPRKIGFPLLQVTFLAYSIVSYVADTTLDIAVACLLYQEEKWWFFGWTVTFIVLPTVIITFFSLRWYAADYKLPGSPKPSRTVWVIRVILLLTLLGPAIRYVDALRYLILFWKSSNYNEKLKYYHWMIYENADAALLRLFEAFLEAAPQTLLQIYILSSSDGNSYTVATQVVSCVLSLLSISWALSSQQRTMRISQKNSIKPSFWATNVQGLWFLFVTTSRMLSLGLFASMFPAYLSIICAVRWIIMFIWLQTLVTTFCDSKYEEVFYKCVLAAIYLFCYLNPEDSPTRWRYVFFYLYTFIENSVLIAVWYAMADQQLSYKLPAILLVFLSFIIGIVFMLVYYLVLHPTRNIHLNGWCHYRRKSNTKREDSYQTRQDNAMMEVPDHIDMSCYSQRPVSGIRQQSSNQELPEVNFPSQIATPL